VYTVKSGIFALALGLVLSAPVAAWGPVTHQVFACRALAAYDSSCFATASGRSFVLGSSAPDAFKLYLEGGRELHTFEYAVFQLRYAQGNPGTTTANFDAVGYSRAFGTHLAEDAVGHHSDGYLPSGTEATKDHLHEAALDTDQARAFPGLYESQRFAHFGESVIVFSTAAIRAYGKEKGSDQFSQVTREVIVEAMRRFDRLETWEQIAIAVNLPYRREMVALDPYGAADFNQARENFERASKCSIAAGARWQSAMSDLAMSASGAREAVEENVAIMFGRGECQPVARP
jgi:hypothetical protein